MSYLYLFILMTRVRIRKIVLYIWIFPQSKAAIIHTIFSGLSALFRKHSPLSPFPARTLMATIAKTATWSNSVHLARLASWNTCQSHHCSRNILPCCRHCFLTMSHCPSCHYQPHRNHPRLTHTPSFPSLCYWRGIKTPPILRSTDRPT